MVTKRQAISLIGLAAMSCAATVAQSSLPISPDIHPDNTVTFHLKAPEAGQVTLVGDWPGGIERTKVAMTKDSQGVWSVTVGPIKPDLWTYSFIVDGARVADDFNPHFNYDRWGDFFQSFLFIPGSASYNYEMHDVPHGTVSAIWYKAPTLKLPAKRALVYTPPDYERSKRHYPVLYLSANEETGWTLLGRAPNILDNLLAARQAKEMIVVMLNTQPDAAASSDATDEPLPSTVGLPSRILPQKNEDGGRLNSPAMLTGGDSIALDLVPYIDKAYRTKPDRDHRAIAGMSSSGAAAFYAAMNHLKLFSWIGVFSGGFPTYPGVWKRISTPDNAAQFYQPGPDINQSADMAKLEALMPGMNASADLRLLYFAVGSNDALTTTQTLLDKDLDDNGLKHTTLIVQGFHHEWRFWRWCLNDFAPRLFQDAKE